MFPSLPESLHRIHGRMVTLVAAIVAAGALCAPALASADTRDATTTDTPIVVVAGPASGSWSQPAVPGAPAPGAAAARPDFLSGSWS